MQNWSPGAWATYIKGSSRNNMTFPGDGCSGVARCAAVCPEPAGALKRHPSAGDGQRLQVESRSSEMGLGSSMWHTNDWRLASLVVLVVFVWLVAVAFGASAFLLRIHNLRKARFWRRLEAKWEAALPEVLSGASPAESLTRLVERGEELYYVDFLFRNARNLGRRERALLGGLAGPHLGRIADRIRNGDAERRGRAVQTVAVLAFDQHVPALVGALDDPSPLVAMTAARALAREDGARFGGEVMSRLARFQDWSPKFLTSMLAAMGPGGAPVLRQGLSDCLLPPGLRAVCADALGQLRDVAAAETAAEVADAEVEADVLAACLRLLRRVGGPGQLPTIRRLVRSSDDGVRAQAVGALGRVGTDDDVARLRDAQADPSPWVVMQAERALRRRNELEVVQAAATNGTAPPASAGNGSGRTS